MWLGRLSRHSALIAAVAFYGTVSLAATTLFYKELYVFSAFPYFINNLNIGLTATIAAALTAALTCLLPAPPHGVSTWTALSGALGRPRQRGARGVTGRHAGRAGPLLRRDAVRPSPPHRPTPPPLRGVRFFIDFLKV